MRTSIWRHNMTRISFLIEKEDLENLKKQSEETDAPVSELIRRSVKRYIIEQSKQKGR